MAMNRVLSCDAYLLYDYIFMDKPIYSQKEVFNFKCLLLDCVDNDPSDLCKAWADNNGCHTSSYVLKNCAKACNSPLCNTNGM